MTFLWNVPNTHAEGVDVLVELIEQGDGLCKHGARRMQSQQEREKKEHEDKKVWAQCDFPKHET
jgi:hypothetical protein